MAMSKETGTRLWESRWEGWKKAAAEKHEGKYTYPSSEKHGFGPRATITIVCPEHGPFEQSPAKHLEGKGCPKCRGLGTDKVLELKAEFPEWDWSGVSIKTTKELFTLVCPEHGPFETHHNRLMTKKARGHTSPCPKCGRASGGLKRRIPVDEWAQRITDLYGGKLVLDKSSVTVALNKARFTCTEHGDFSSYLQDVVAGHGCMECGRARQLKWSDENLSSTFEEFMEKVRERKTTDYEYDESTYLRSKDRMRIICKKHGEFWQTPNSHIDCDNGCPSCAKSISKGEYELRDYLISLGVEVDARNRMLDGWEIDIYLPGLKVGIEYCGLHWHGEFKKDKGYHAEKLRRAREKGIKLITVFEDEWRYLKPQVMSRLSHTLGTSSRLAARKCEVATISWSEAKEYLASHHIQGAGKPAPHCYALKHGGNIVAVATWGEDRFSNEGGLELYRFCSSSLTSVQGGLSKLVKAAQRDLAPKRLVTYADLRWGDGESYAKAGFKKVGETAPGYFWCKKDRRYNRHSFQKHKLKDVLATFDPEKTEVENCHANGYWRIYDCGHSKWELRAE